MNQKPSFKQIAILNLVNNIPMAIIMSTASPLIAGQPLEIKNWTMNVLIAFVIACIINAVLPIPKIVKKTANIFKADENSFKGSLIGNIPVAFIFVVIIGLVLTYYNVRMVPVFIFAFLQTFLPLYVICFIVSIVTNPIAMKLSGMSEK